MAETVRLSLICHASTLAMRTRAFPQDEPLDPRGKREACALRRGSVRGAPVWTGPELRTIETADALGVASAVHPMLRDCGYGRWSGRSFDDVQAEEPDAIAIWLREVKAAPHGGESVVALIARVADWLASQQDGCGRVVAVTHPSIIRAAIVHALGANPQSFWRIDVAPLTSTTLSGHDGRWNLSAMMPLRNSEV